MGLRPFLLPLFTGVRGIGILRTSRRRRSQKFARLSGGHTIVCLIRKMVKSAPAKMANRQTKNATVECRPSLLNGASVRALSTTSSATLASMAATAAIERKALWIILGPLYTLYDLESWPSLSCPYSRSTWKKRRILGSSRLQAPPPRHVAAAEHLEGCQPWVSRCRTSPRTELGNVARCCDLLR
jgi:hypothetical protein